MAKRIRKRGTPDERTTSTRPARGGRSSDHAARKPWTVMVYMVASKDEELDAAAGRDLAEMVRGALNNSALHLAVQVKRPWPEDPERFEIRGGRLAHAAALPSSDGNAEPSPDGGKPANMGREKTLSEFVAWAHEAYPADHRLLILWGHSYGVGFGRDHGDPLTIGELARAVDPDIQSRGGPRPFEKIDILAANACAMSYVEAAYELRKAVSWMVASQIAVPYAGWPYEQLFRSVSAKTTPEDFGRLLVRSYVAASAEGSAMSLLNLAQLDKDDIREHLRALTREIHAYMAGDPKRVNEMRDIFLSTHAGDVRPLIDINDLCDRLTLPLTAPDSERTKAAAQVRTTAAALQQVLRGDQKDTPGVSADGLGGIGIFVPAVTDPEHLRRLELLDPGDDGDQPPKDYWKLSLFKPRDGKSSWPLKESDGKSSWPHLVYRSLAAPMPDVFVKAVVGTGATARADRLDIARIMISIDAEFNSLDRVLESERKQVDQMGQFAYKLPNLDALAGFGAPDVRLLPPLSASDLERVRTADAARGDLKSRAGEHRSSDSSKLIERVTNTCRRLEGALARVEQATVRGLTHAQLGLGPLDPTGFRAPSSEGRFAKPAGLHGIGDTKPAGLHGLDDLKPAGLHGQEAPFDADAGRQNRTGDLRLDLALARVVELFAQVAAAFQQLERLLGDTEAAYRDTLLMPPLALTASDVERLLKQRLERGFDLLEEAASHARSVVRQVLTHPVYGIGPGGPGLGLAERRELARAGGLSIAKLRLLTLKYVRSPEELL